MKKFKKVFPYILYVILILAACVGTMYAAVILGDLPISLPGVYKELTDGTIDSTTQYIMSQWSNFYTYEPKDSYPTVEEMIEAGVVEVDEITNDELLEMFPLIDPETLDTFLEKNPEYLANGYEMLFIDLVDYQNTPTGIKTIYGDDVLAVDAIDGIMIIGRDVVSSTGTSKVKMAIVNNKSKLDMSMVKDLGYWDVIRKHATDSNALLAVNASSYVWHDSQNYATLYGASRYHGVDYRKATESEKVVCFDAEGNMTIGTDISEAYNAFEAVTVLFTEDDEWETEFTPVTVIEDTEEEVDPEDSTDTDEDVIDDTDEDDDIDAASDVEIIATTETTSSTSTFKAPVGRTYNTERSAQSAMAQTADGTTYILIASGSTYGSNLGVIDAEIAEIFKEYDAVNAVTLSGGSRAIMYWNGRIVNETVDYDDEGVRLPNTIFVKQYDTSGNSTESAE